jgi:hypothetical protein
MKATIIDRVSKLGVCLLLMCNMQLMVYAGQSDNGAPSAAIENNDHWQQLQTLVTTINNTRERLIEVRAELRKSSDERERKRLEAEEDQLSLDLESLQTAWEMLATGGADLQMFGVKTEKAFDWRDELQSVFEPILVELKRLTERPRKIERLRTDKAYYQQRLDVAEQALQSIKTYDDNAPTPLLKQAFATLEERWSRRRDDLKNHRDIVDFELQETLAPSTAQQRDPVEALKELLSGRVLNLFLAIVVMTVVYLLLRLLIRSYNRYLTRQTRRRQTFAARVINLLFYLFTSLAVLFSGVAVFYVRGDWLLLGLLILVLAGAAIVAQRTLPRFLMEAKLILNLGPVREGERIIFNALPWKVSTLSFYASLSNPLLQGGTLQIPVRELVNYYSRHYDENEPWFPTRVGDYAILADNTYGKILTQTPEVVQMLVMGSVKTYGVDAFLDQNPLNLSQQGFTLKITFGLDYQHQAQITGAIRDQMEKGLIAGLHAAGMANYLDQLGVEFDQANASSLDLAILAKFNGSAAEHYFRLKRLLQRLAVDLCNQSNWTIPFTQITVHNA